MGYFKTNILHLPPTRDNPGTMVFYRKTSILPAPKCLSKCCASQKYQHFRKTQNPPGLWGLGIPRSALISLIVGALYEDDSLTSHARIPIPKNARQLPCQVCSLELSTSNHDLPGLFRFHLLRPSGVAVNKTTYSLARHGFDCDRDALISPWWLLIWSSVEMSETYSVLSECDSSPLVCYYWCSSCWFID